MELTISGFFERHKLFGKPDANSFLRIWTTHPVNPLYTTVFCNTIDEKAVVQIPTKPTYDALVIEFFELYESHETRIIYNHAGSAFLCATDFIKNSNTARVQLLNENNEAAASLVVSVTIKPVATVLYPLTDEVCQMSTACVKDASSWYINSTKKLAPLVDALKTVHLPRFACRFDKLPGYFFAVQLPTADESEVLFIRALTIASERRGHAVLEIINNVPQYAVVVVEALAAIPNSFAYNADVRLNENREPFIIERFSADARLLRNGDCEDLAREVITLAHSLRNGVYTAPVVCAAQAIMRQYVACEMFSAIQMEGELDTSNKKNIQAYSLGNSLFAHAHNVFIPANFMQAALKRAGSDVELKTGISQVTPNLEVLAVDGITPFDARPFRKTHKCISESSGLHPAPENRPDNRPRHFDDIGHDYYKFPCSFFVLQDMWSARPGTHVHEFYFFNKANKKYGCTFDDLILQNANIAIKETHIMSHAEETMAAECMRYFQPIPPYAVTKDPLSVDLTTFDRVFKMKRVATRPARFYANFMISSEDVGDEKYLMTLKKRMLTNKDLSYVVDYFADNTFCLHIYVG
jgi:hypothetical protein